MSTSKHTFKLYDVVEINSPETGRYNVLGYITDYQIDSMFPYSIEVGYTYKSVFLESELTYIGEL